MKNFCIVGISAGDTYQSFIPLYIFSILNNYPEYSVLIFSNTQLSNKTKQMLNLLKGMGQFEVVDNYTFGLDNNLNILNYRFGKQVIRYLFFDHRFNQFETLYFGDIDIFICKEDGGIYEQHSKHCNVLNLPYSNYIRAIARVEKINLKREIKNIFTGKPWGISKSTHNRIVVENRLTGLHFVKTKEYFEKVEPLFPYFINLISDDKKRIHPKRDEEILYDLIKQSGLGLPPISPNSSELDNANYHSIAFNPLHGIHLGIFRDKSTIIRARQILQSYIFESYYRQYKDIKKNNPILQELIDLSDNFVKQQFLSMENYYDFSESVFYENL